MKRFQFFFLLILLMYIAACKPKQNTQMNMDTLINNQVYSIVDDYSVRHPQYKSLFFITDFEYNWRNSQKESNVILLGPSLDRLSKKERLYPSQVLHYKDKLIFIQSSSGFLYETSEVQKLYHKHSLKVDKRRDNIAFFLREAAAFRVSNFGKFMKISDRADTIILKERVEFQAPPVMDNSSKYYE